MEVGQYVVVTTNKYRRGVFGGILQSHDITAGCAVLTEARNCVYWSAETHGVGGLAVIGPQNGSRIGPAIPELSLDGVTAVMLATDQARAAWEAEPWS